MWHKAAKLNLDSRPFSSIYGDFVDHRSAKYHGYSKNVRLCFTMKLAIVCPALQVYQSMNLIYLERRQQWHTTVCCLKTTILLGPRNSSTVEITVIDFLSGSSLSFLLFIVYLNFWICKWYRSNSEEVTSARDSAGHGVFSWGNRPAGMVTTLLTRGKLDIDFCCIWMIPLEIGGEVSFFLIWSQICMFERCEIVINYECDK